MARLTNPPRPACYPCPPACPSREGRISATAATVLVSNDLLAILRDLGEEPTRALEEAAVLELFRRGVLSRGRAAEILDIDLLSFMRLASDRGIPVMDAEPDEFDRDLDRTRTILGR